MHNECEKKTNQHIIASSCWYSEILAKCFWPSHSLQLCWHCRRRRRHRIQPINFQTSNEHKLQFYTHKEREQFVAWKISFVNTHTRTLPLALHCWLAVLALKRLIYRRGFFNKSNYNKFFCLFYVKRWKNDHHHHQINPFYIPVHAGNVNSNTQSKKTHLIVRRPFFWNLLSFCNARND